METTPGKPRVVPKKQHSSSEMDAAGVETFGQTQIE